MAKHFHFINGRLRELREKGKNQTGLAQALDVHPARITEIIKGDRQIKISELPAMADYLEMSVSDIVWHLIRRR